VSGRSGGAGAPGVPVDQVLGEARRIARGLRESPCSVRDIVGDGVWVGGEPSLVEAGEEGQEVLGRFEQPQTGLRLSRHQAAPDPFQQIRPAWRGSSGGVQFARRPSGRGGRGRLRTFRGGCGALRGCVLHERLTLGENRAVPSQGGGSGPAGAGRGVELARLQNEE